MLKKLREMSADRGMTRMIVVILFVVAIALSATGVSDRIIGFAGVDRLSTANDEFLQRSFDRALNGFMVLSGIKIVVSIIEGSAVGVGFNLEVGDVAQPAYDYVDIAWRTVLTGSVVLLMTRYFLAIAASFDHIALALAFVFLLMMLILKWYQPGRRRLLMAARSLALIFVVLAVALSLILPLAIAGGAYLSEKITKPSVTEAESELEQVRDTLYLADQREKTETLALPSVSKKIQTRPATPDEAKRTLDEMKREMVPENIREENGGLFERVKDFRERMGAITDYLTDKARHMTIWIITLIAGYIFDCILFPYALFIVLFWVTKVAAQHLFDFGQRDMFRYDLEDLFRKYYKLPERDKPPENNGPA